MNNNDQYWIEHVKERLQDPHLSGTERAYLSRIIRVYDMPNLTKVAGNPVHMVVESIVKSDFFAGFEDVVSPEVVGEFETFDLFNFPEDHVARRPSDSYFIKKTPNKEENILLRTHTTIAWYHYLLKQGGKEKLEKTGDIRFLSYGKVYRVDELDKSHHECFHQIDGLRIAEKSREIINQDTLREVLSNIIKALFGADIEYRFNVDQFPYTLDSLEAEVKFKGKWLEVLGAGVVHPAVLAKLGIDGEKYNGWAFGFGIERLAMILKEIPDIRIFWSHDPRITAQWGNLDPYREVSNYPPVYKDISLVVPKEKFQKDLKEEQKSGELELTRDTESNFFAITGIIRDIGGDLIEEVKIIDMYENDAKFGKENTSLTLNITFRSIERTLTNDEINKVYFEIRRKLEGELGYELR